MKRKNNKLLTLFGATTLGCLFLLLFFISHQFKEISKQSLELEILEIVSSVLFTFVISQKEKFDFLIHRKSFRSYSRAAIGDLSVDKLEGQHLVS